jgi:hypothetical protein
MQSSARGSSQKRNQLGLGAERFRVVLLRAFLAKSLVQVGREVRVNVFLTIAHQMDFPGAEMPKLIQRMIRRRRGTGEHFRICEICKGTL